MKPYLYTLDEDGNPVPQTDVLVWAKWLSTIDRFLAETVLADGTVVSTVFTGIDFAHLTGRRPCLYETVVLGGAKDKDRQIYATRAEAEKGHDQMVELCKWAATHQEKEVSKDFIDSDEATEKYVALLTRFGKFWDRQVSEGRVTRFDPDEWEAIRIFVGWLLERYHIRLR